MSGRESLRLTRIAEIAWDVERQKIALDKANALLDAEMQKARDDGHSLRRIASAARISNVTVLKRTDAPTTLRAASAGETA